MIERDFISRTEWKRHLKTDWRRVHNLWPHLKEYIPGWGYSKAEIDAFFEGYDGGKAQVHWDRVTGKPATFSPSAHASSHEKGGADLIDTLADLTVDKLTIGSYYLDSLIANNKVPDSDKLDNLHASNFLQNPATAALDMNGYAVLNAEYYRASGGETDLMVGDELDAVNRLFTDATNNLIYKNADNNFGAMKIGSLVLGSYYLNSLIAHNKVPDSDKVDGQHASDFLISPMAEALDMNGYAVFGAEYFRASGGASGVMFGDELAGVNRLFTDVSNTLIYKSAADTYGAFKIASLTIGSYYLNSLIANNKVPDSDKVDGLHAASFLTNPMTASLDMDGYAILDAEYCKAIGGATPVVFGDDVSSVNRLFTDVSNTLLYYTSGDVLGAIKAASFVLGSYYLNSLVANNKVPDSDKLDNKHASEFLSSPMGGSLDMNGYALLNAEYFRASGGASNLMVGDEIVGVNRLYTDVDDNLEYKNAANNYGAFKIGSVVIGSYYLNSLIANNKVPDSDKWDGYHFADYLDQAVKQASSPQFATGTKIYNTDHSALIVENEHANARGGIEVESSLPILNVGLNTGRGIPEKGTDPLCMFFRVDARSTVKRFSWWYEEAGQDVERELMKLGAEGSAGSETGNLNIAKLTIGSYYLNSLIANNKVPDSDKLDNKHASEFLSSPMGGSLDMNGYALLNAEYYRATGGATNLMVGDELAGVNRLFTDGGNNLAYKNAANNYGAMILGSLTLGSYYLNSLVAHNKVPDSDKLDSYHHTSFMKLSGGTFTSHVYAADHPAAATDAIVNVCYGTGSPPTANLTTIGTLFVKYTA